MSNKEILKHIKDIGEFLQNLSVDPDTTPNFETELECVVGGAIASLKIHAERLKQNKQKK